MAVVTMLFRAELRQRWASWLLLGVLVALVSGLVLAGVVAGRRTVTAFPQFEAGHGFDAYVYSFSPLPQISKLPDVASVVAAESPPNGQATCACTHSIREDGFTLYALTLKNLHHVAKLVGGRMPDPSAPNQVLASFTLQSDGVHIGTVIRVPLASLDQRAAYVSGGNVTPDGPTLALHVVGIEAAESELPGDGATSYDDLYGTRALTTAFRNRTFSFWTYFVQLKHGAADLPQFDAKMQALGADGTSDQDTPAASVSSAIHPQAVGWWILSGLTALVGMVVLAQAFTRQSVVEAQNHGTLSALGVSRRQMVLFGMARTLAIGLVGIGAGVVLAFLLSPFTPVGEARLGEVSTGFTFDPLILFLGALVALVLVLVLGLVPALRSARVEPQGTSNAVIRPSQTVGLLSRAGAPPSVLIGVRRALERGRGRNAVPVGSALLGSVLAVGALCATSVFGASLTHLTVTPTLYGQPFAAWLGSNELPTTPNPVLSDLKHTKAITAITGGISGDVRINGKTVDALAGDSVRGPLLLTTVNGRLPSSDHDITLGASTMRAAGAHVGSLVTVTAPRPSGGTRTSTFRVVGTTSFPPDFGAGGLGTGAVFTFGGYFAAQCPPGPTRASCEKAAGTNIGGVYLLRFESGPPGRVALSRLAHTDASLINYPVTPANLVNFGEAVNFPLILGLVLIVFGVTTLVHVLVVSVVRRRREVGLLKTLGFVRRQIAFSVWWQTMAIAFVGVVIGVPLGTVAGRATWHAFAHNLGVFPDAVVATWAMVAVAAGTFVVANILAIGPAVVAARSRPASLLRSE